MYLLIAHIDTGIYYFGPFKSEARANEYALSLPKGVTYEIRPLIKPFND